MPTFPTLSQFDFHHTLEAHKGVSIAFFTSTGCASCAFWKLLLTKYCLQYPEVTVYEIDAKQDQALAEEFSLFHLPALFLYSNGVFRSELQCEARLEKLTEAIADALNQPPQEMP